MVVVERAALPKTIAVIIPKGLYQSELLTAGIKQTCKQHDAEAEIIEYASESEQDEIIMCLGSSKYSGAILHPKFSDESASTLTVLNKKHYFPIALIGRPDQQNMGLWPVDRNELSTGYMAADHLLQMRYARIGIVVSRCPYDVAFLNGYLKAMREYNAQVRDSYVQYVEDEDSPGDSTRELITLEKRPAKAIIYAHPEDAVRGLEVMRARDILPGKQMGIVCNGDFPGSENCKPPITIIKYDLKEIGQKAAKLIFYYISCGRSRPMYCFEKAVSNLIIRESSLKNGKEPISLSDIQRRKRGLARDRHTRLSRYLRDVYHPGWWKTTPGGWEREELYYRSRYRDW
jgi:DNA-binding LacI/PurR family transcriptional regulator